MADRVCVTGGTGYVALCLIMELLRRGYWVNTTIRNHPGSTKDLSFLVNQSIAPGRVSIFEADLDEPESFIPAISGCRGVFHVAHPMEWDENETGDAKTKRVLTGLLGILKASLDSKTVKRFVYTSSATAVIFNDKNVGDFCEDSWTDIDYLRTLGLYGDSYVITKTLAEKTALEFGDRYGLDVVTLAPTWINGPFLGSRCPNSVKTSLALIFGDQEAYKYLIKTSFVHVEDVAAAHVHIFEHSEAEGRYICSAVETTIHELLELFSARYPQYKIPTAESLKGISAASISGLSSKKAQKNWI